MAAVLSVVAPAFYFQVCKRNSVSNEFAVLVVYTLAVVFFGFVFSRAAVLMEAILVNHRRISLSELNEPVFHFYGALMGFSLIWAISVWLPQSQFKQGAVNFFNALAITACLILVFGKLGCFMDGHEGCGGVATTLPWGVKYGWGSARSAMPLHPVQIYDALVALGLLWLLYYKVPIRWAGVAFLALWSIVQIGMEYICPAPKVFAGGLLNLAQVTYLSILGLAIVGLAGLLRGTVRQ